LKRDSRKLAQTRNENGRQARKSRETKKAILEATIRCFIDYGYLHTTLTRIADYANVSRGAMSHHFESRKDVISSAVAYLYEKRLREYEKLIAAATRGFSNRPDVAVTRAGLEQTVRALWKYFNLPSYRAHTELYVAARTNHELAASMEPLERQYESEIPKIIRTLFPVWAQMEEARELLSDLLLFTLKGMSMSYMHYHKQERLQNLLEHLVDDCVSVYESTTKPGNIQAIRGRLR